MRIWVSQDLEGSSVVISDVPIEVFMERLLNRFLDFFRRHMAPEITVLHIV